MVLKWRGRSLGARRYGAIPGRSLRRRKWLSAHSGAVAPRPPASMRLLAAAALLLATLLSCLASATRPCEPDQAHYGCKTYGSTCVCSYGCKSEFIYRTQRDCLNTLKDRSSNNCLRMPCLTGICIQTAQEPGFTCKCEGTGYYGRRCEKACPSQRKPGLVFPHECVVI